MFGSPSLMLQQAISVSITQAAGDSVASLRSLLDNKLNVSVPLPRIRPGTLHFKYALFIIAGYPSADACSELDIPTKTAESWRKQVRDAAAARYGFRAEYHRIAADIIDYELTLLQNRPIPTRLATVR